MQRLYIVRGLPGSGKSTYAKELVGKLCGNVEHFEADMYFCRNDEEEYRFVPKDIGKAHEWCLAAVAASLSFGHDVVVSNTFTKMWEMQKYFCLVKDLWPKHNIEIVVIEMLNRFDNIHEVPEKTLQSMQDRWEPLPGHIVDYSWDSSSANAVFNVIKRKFTNE